MSTGNLEGLFVADGQLTCCTLLGSVGQPVAVAGDESGAVYVLSP